MEGLRNSICQLLLLTTVVVAQRIGPANSSSIDNSTLYPRFIAGFSGGSLHIPNTLLAPLGQYAQISHQYFASLKFKGPLIQTSGLNANLLRKDDFAYISCDPDPSMSPADQGRDLGPAELLQIISGFGVKNSIIFYTRKASHCDIFNYPNNTIPGVSGVYTTVDPVWAGQVADMNVAREDYVQVLVEADLSSYTDTNAPFYNNTSNMPFNTGPTAAVAMIVLYTVTGLITLLFLSIIMTGAIRAHRHPERYGPRRASDAYGGQSRARGIARAMLETIPIVKFGDQKVPSKQDADVEMTTAIPKSHEPPAKAAAAETLSSTIISETITKPQPIPANPKSPISNADGSDESGVLGCSICTEEFHQGEEVRVLPCNHKYHPDCVDPWLLNVSGTCPLCRVDLRGSPANDEPVDPLASYASPTHALRYALMGSREDRIAALRSFRVERNRHGESESVALQNEEERRGLARRMTDRFRILTRRHGHGHGHGGAGEPTS